MELVGVVCSMRWKSVCQRAAQPQGLRFRVYHLHGHHYLQLSSLKPSSSSVPHLSEREIFTMPCQRQGLTQPSHLCSALNSRQRFVCDAAQFGTTREVLRIMRWGALLLHWQQQVSLCCRSIHEKPRPITGGASHENVVLVEFRFSSSKAEV